MRVLDYGDHRARFACFKEHETFGEASRSETRNIEGAKLDADLVWLCVPDREIRVAAAALAQRAKGRVRFAFHSSGALISRELDPLRKTGIATASVHPLMTFVPGSRPSLAGVPFALEGDAAAMRIARKIVRDLGGVSFSLPASRKPAYHAWATMTSAAIAGVPCDFGGSGPSRRTRARRLATQEHADHPADAGELRAPWP